MSFCLPKIEVEKFISALKDGRIDPAKLADMTSEERRTFFTDLVGKDDAREVNAQFESKLLLKNQQAGMINWAKSITGIKESVRRDIIYKIEKMDKVLNPKDEQSFLEDLAAKKLGTDVSFEEAQKIAEMSKQVTEAKANLTSENRLDFGAKKVALMNYVNELKLSGSETTLQGLKEDFKSAPVSTAVQGVSKLAGFAKGIKASLDDSAIFRQGWRTLFTNPSIWADNAFKSFTDIATQVGRTAADDRIMNEVKADIFSRPNSLDGTYKKMKLDIGTGEEAYPTTLPERIPLFGRLYKASEVAYQGFLYRMRADIADKLVDIAKQNGVDMTDDFQVRSMGKLINSLTGRGSLGAFEKVGKSVNTLFFSPKSVKASFDFLTLHAADKMSTFARKQAAMNLLKVASGMAVILGIAKAIQPQSVELDPRSADFGKIRIKDTRFDVSGGMGSLITLAARLLENSSKSSTSGNVSQLNSGKFGAATSQDVFFDFLSNKLSPAASVVKEIANRKDFNGNPVTVQGEASNLLMPLPVTNIQELLNNPNSAPFLISEIADSLGIVTNTYSPKKK